MTTRQTPDAVREAIIAAITKADANFGYSYRLTKMDETGEEHTLFMDGFEPAVFQDREDGYPVIEQRRNAARTDAILAIPAILAALDSRAGDAVPSDVLPATIGRVHLGERRSDGERLCSHGHPVAAGHPLYWPVQISQYDDSDPLCLTHAIDQLESDNADWGEDYEAVDAVPAGEVERLKIAREAAASVFDEDDQTHLAAAIRAGREDHISQVQAALAALSHGEGRK